MEDAIKNYADRKNPNYNDSVKHSISGKKSLSESIKHISSTFSEKQVKDDFLSFANPIERLYGWTSNHVGGIRHGAKPNNATHSLPSHPRKEDARYCLIVCSAFLNWLSEKHDIPTEIF